MCEYASVNSQKLSRERCLLLEVTYRVGKDLVEKCPATICRYYWLYSSEGKNNLIIFPLRFCCIDLCVESIVIHLIRMQREGGFSLMA